MRMKSTPDTGSMHTGFRTCKRYRYLKMRLLFLFLISLNTNLFSQENKKIIDDFINEGIELWGIPE